MLNLPNPIYNKGDDIIKTPFNVNFNYINRFYNFYMKLKQMLNRISIFLIINIKAQELPLLVKNLQPGLLLIK